MIGLDRTKHRRGQRAREPPTASHQRAPGQTGNDVKFNLKKQNFSSDCTFQLCVCGAEEGRASTPGGARRAQVTGLLTNLPKWLQILYGSCRWQGCLLFIWPSRCIYETYVKVCVCVCVDVCVSCASATVLRMLLMLAPDRPSTFK